MLDLILVGSILAFFAVAVFYVRGCERLEEDAVEIEYLVGGIVALLLIAYLVYALLRPERF